MWVIISYNNAIQVHNCVLLRLSIEAIIQNYPYIYQWIIGVPKTNSSILLE